MTSEGPWARAATARTAAEAPVIVVTQGMPCRSAAERISAPSTRAPEPVGVLITRSQARFSIRSTTCGEPSAIFLIDSTGIPMREIAWAVPPVATTLKPRSWNRAASWVATALSVSVTEMKTVPSSGSETPAAAWALPKAVGKSGPMPITSPVLFISGPRTESAP